MEQKTKEQLTAQVFALLPGLIAETTPTNKWGGRIIKFNADTKVMMDTYNKHYAPEIDGRKKIESVNCYPCVKKVFMFFEKLQAEMTTS